ncbi:Guanine nucleotide-binding protein, beta subunit [Pelomyxa schiedti]|nr:Guanine nucleotide-binding protein, beta subunit [Pelomyxa schiedti]
MSAHNKSESGRMPPPALPASGGKKTVGQGRATQQPSKLVISPMATSGNAAAEMVPSTGATGSTAPQSSGPVVQMPTSATNVTGTNSGALGTVQEIDSADVVRLILQFLKENNLLTAMRALQTESQVMLNTVDNLDAFVSDIKNGHWDSVLQATSTLKLPSEKLMDLYEHIIMELAELRELEAARALLKQTQPMLYMKNNHPERFVSLDRMLQLGYIDPTDLYGSISKENRRATLAQTLSSEVVVVPPSRLLSLLCQSLKWQRIQGMLPPDGKFDLFRGATVTRAIENEMYPKSLERIIKLGKTGAECIKFSPDGQYLVMGSIDGFIEVWDWETGKINTMLKYQADDEFMLHENTAVLCMCFSRDSETLATGARDGGIKVWTIRTGKCLRRFDRAHEQGVTCLAFAYDSGAQQLLSGSYDCTARVHGLKSGKTLKVFRGHTSYVNDAVYSHNSAWVVTASSDSTVKVWDAKTTDCLLTFKPSLLKTTSSLTQPTTPMPGATGSTTPTSASSTAGANVVAQHIRDCAVIGLLHNPSNIEQLLVLTQSNVVHLVTLKGQSVRTFTANIGVDSLAPTAPTTTSSSIININPEVKTVETALELEKAHQAELNEELHKNSMTDSTSTGAAVCFTSFSVSPRGDWLHCGAQDGALYSFSVATGKMEHVMRTHEKEVEGVIIHPHHNVVATHADDGSVKLWKS